MSRRAQLISLLISLAVSGFSVYQLRNYSARYGLPQTIYSSLIVCSAIFILIVLYMSVIKRLSKGNLDQKKYARLFELENSVVTGELEFYFVVEDSRDIKFSILSKEMQHLETVKEGNVASGGHIVRYATDNLADGVYFYCLETDNQKTMKRMRVQHVKVTA